MRMAHGSLMATKCLRAVLLLLSLLLLFARQTVGRRLNVLVVLVDDLRPENPSYNAKSVVSTPNLEALAGSAVQFDNAHASAGLCGPSRASMLSGRKPQSLNYYQHRLKVGKKAVDREITTRSSNEHIPQYFRRHGYEVRASGKVYHSKRDMAKTFGSKNILHTLTDTCPDNKFMCSTSDKDAVDTAAVNWILDEIEDIEQKSGGKQRWFAIVGIRKPHLPYKVPRRYFQEFQNDDIPVAVVKERPRRSIANFFCRSIQSYREVSSAGASTQLGAAPFPDKLASKLRKGYYAAIGFVDTLVGKVVKHLERHSLMNNTVLVVTSDNGWALGEHGDWCKQTNYDLATRVPLWISDPLSRRNGRVAEVVSLLDIYPTLIDLAGIPAPKTNFLQGASFAHLLRGGRKDSSFSGDQVFTVAARCVDGNSLPKITLFRCSHPNDINYIGFSIRTMRWRYTEWRPVTLGRKWKGEPLRLVNWDLDPFERELYDHNSSSLSNFDHSENINLLASSTVPIGVRTVANRLSPLLRKEFDVDWMSPTAAPTRINPKADCCSAVGAGFSLSSSGKFCRKVTYVQQKQCSKVTRFTQGTRTCRSLGARLCTRNEVLEAIEGDGKCTRGRPSPYVLTSSSCGRGRFFALRRSASGTANVRCFEKKQRHRRGVLVQCCADSC